MQGTQRERDNIAEHGQAQLVHGETELYYCTASQGNLKHPSLL